MVAGDGGVAGEVRARTGETLEHWMRVLDAFGAARKPDAASVEHLQGMGVPRAWARTLAVHFREHEL